MSRKKAFTLVELLVVIAIIALLMAILMPALNQVKELGKRSVCLNNLKTLVMGWGMYADKNDEKIPSANPSNACSWYRCGSSGGNKDETIKEAARRQISTGRIWPYINNMDVYKCPTGLPDEYITYTIVDSMNGTIAANNANISEEGQNKPGVYIKNRLDIKNPAKRIVFLDEGFATQDSFTVYYHQEKWWDTAPVRHDDGATFGFADGHADYKKWEGENTLAYGRKRMFGSELNAGEVARDKEPQSQAEYDDLHWLQLMTWGQLGYPPKGGSDI